MRDDSTGAATVGLGRAGAGGASVKDGIAALKTQRQDKHTQSSKFEIDNAHKRSPAMQPLLSREKPGSRPRRPSPLATERTPAGTLSLSARWYRRSCVSLLSHGGFTKTLLVCFVCTPHTTLPPPVQVAKASNSCCSPLALWTPCVCVCTSLCLASSLWQQACPKKATVKMGATGQESTRGGDRAILFQAHSSRPQTAQELPERDRDSLSTSNRYHTVVFSRGRWVYRRGCKVLAPKPLPDSSASHLLLVRGFCSVSGAVCCRLLRPLLGCQGRARAVQLKPR